MCFESCHKNSFWHFASFSKTVKYFNQVEASGGPCRPLYRVMFWNANSVLFTKARRNGGQGRALLLLPSSWRSHASSFMTPHENIKLPVPRAPYCRIHVEMLSISAAQVNRAIVTGRAPIIAAPLMAERSKSSAIVPSPTATQARTAA